MNSEMLIKKEILRSEDPHFCVVPNITDKILVNAANKIGNGMNPSVIIAVYDTSLLSNGKSGAVFTGTRIYLKSAMCPMAQIGLNGIQEVDFQVDISQDEKGKEKKVETLKVLYESGKTKIIKSTDFLDSMPLEFIGNLLEKMLEDMEEVEETYQIVRLAELGDDVIKSYLTIITAYLKADDGKIDTKEYKELIQLMTTIKVSKELADELREERLNSDKTFPDFSELVFVLDSKLKDKHVTNEQIHQSLFNDLLLVRKEKLEQWPENEDLRKLKELLGITEQQIEIFIRKFQEDEQIIKERLTDNQVKTMAKEFAAVAAGAGVSLAALAVTGGISTGIWGGLLTLGFMSTGGMLLGIAAIGGIGYGAYKGIKYFSGVGEAEKSGIRIAALQEGISAAKRATTYIADDINWLTNKVARLVEEAGESKSLDGEIFDQLSSLVGFMESVNASSQIIEQESQKSEYEIYLAQLSKILDSDRFEELIRLNPNQNTIKEYVYSIYEEKTVTREDGSLKIIYERADELDYEEAKILYAYLESAGYFDVKSSAVAKGKAVMNKGFEALKDVFNG